MSRTAEVIAAVSPVAPYLAPLLPAAVRLGLVLRYLRFMAEPLSEEEQQQEEHRTVILTLAGFSFTASLALPAYGVSAQVDVLIPTFYVVLSFLCYVAALNTQAYKYSRWRDQVASGLADVALFCLLAATIGMVMLLRPPRLYLYALVAVAIVTWSLDMGARIRAWSSYFASRVTTDDTGDVACPKERSEN